jgi:hypothetical protein
MIEALDPNTAKVTVDFGQAHNLSIGMLKELQAAGIDGGTAAVAVVLTAGRILSPEILEEDQEVTYIQAAMDWLGTYFASGGMN